MHRLALGVEYDGTNYSGWQHQLGRAKSIQHEIEKALKAITNSDITVHAAGRTDAGVHASCQVIHFDIELERAEYEWISGINANLNRDIRVLWCKSVPISFDARRSALARRYIYLCYNSPTRPSLLNNNVGWYFKKLDEKLMNQAAQKWVGEHDFTSFRGAGCQSKSPKRNIMDIYIKRRGDLIIFDIIANAFLYHMVRNMVGSLVDIGARRVDLDWAEKILDMRDRRKAGPTAAASGLYLQQIIYPEEYSLPIGSRYPWFITWETKDELV